jgi:hypothetical protein
MIMQLVRADLYGLNDQSEFRERAASKAEFCTCEPRPEPNPQNVTVGWLEQVWVPALDT